MAFAAPGPVVVVATACALITIAGAAIVARLWLRLKIQKRRLLVSDILMGLAFVCAIITMAITVKMAQVGALDVGVKQNLVGFDGTDDEIAFALKIFWVLSFPFFSTLYFCKAALLAVYLQVFPVSMRKRRIFLWTTVGFAAVSYVVSIMLVLCICMPIQSNWSVDKPCPVMRPALIFRVAWALHFAGDILVFALPWLIVPGLQMKRWMKTGVYCTFLLGLINITFCLLRFITIETSAVNEGVSMSLISLWNTLDCNIGLVIACLPSLRPYLRGRQGSDYEAYTKSATARPSEAGFNVINEPYRAQGVRTATADSDEVRIHGHPSYSNGFDNDPWDGKKSNASDVELVQIKTELR
ncbi:hypothetical protein B0J13DRAFT_82584 [Dactylonectria estremocensis]|uniref:Rhodopsin domain-containing protein n=1 Tax=Dactylonectria estremocensis TaxID=1079267 RepID=A0A9P9IZS2_9HYPO|nr:hypothetical protein B0J13DRAFT_82584 [Dactylonectria estremocensis]